MNKIFSSFFKKISTHKKILFFILFCLILPFFSFAADNNIDTKDIGIIDKFVDGIENTIGKLALVIVGIFSQILWVAAVIFDNLLAIGLSVKFFDTSFIKTAWTSIKDFSNAAFILGFLYVAFQVMIGQNSNWSATFVKIIIVALVMNFSLFFSRVIVDAGNITAHLFYDAIGTPYEKNDDEPDHFMIARQFYESGQIDENTNNFRSIAAYFQSFVEPETLFGVDSFKAWKATNGGNSSMASFVFMCVLISAYLVMMAKTLFQGGFFFLARIIWLMFYMIISPLALISMFIPKMESYWKEWLENIFKRSFCIAVYLFFIWLASLMLSSGLIDDIKDDSSTFLFIISIFAFKGIMIYLILEKATKYGGKFCGDTGNLGMKALMGTAGMIVKRSPLGLAARTGLNLAGTSIYSGKIAQKFLNKPATSGNFVTKYAATKMKLYGDKMTKVKINGISGTEEMDKRRKERDQIRDTLPTNAQKSMYNAAQTGKVDYHNINEKNEDGSFKEYHGFTSQDKLEKFMMKADITDKDIANNDGSLVAALSNASSKDENDINQLLAENYNNVSMQSQKGIMGIINKVASGDSHAKQEETKAAETKKNVVSDKKREESQKIAVREARELRDVDNSADKIANVSSSNLHLSSLNVVQNAIKELSDGELSADNVERVKELQGQQTKLKELYGDLEKVEKETNLNRFDSLKDEIEMLEDMRRHGASDQSINEQEQRISAKLYTSDNETRRYFADELGIDPSDSNAAMEISSAYKKVKNDTKTKRQKIQESIQGVQTSADKSIKAIQKSVKEMVQDKKAKIKTVAKYDRERKVREAEHEIDVALEKKRGIRKSSQTDVTVGTEDTLI